MSKINDFSKSEVQVETTGFLDKFFKLSAQNTNVRTELIAGFTTFLTMVYIVFVNPSILGVAGIDVKVAFVTTALIAALGSIFMGLFTNLPVALAPAMGLNAFFAFGLVKAMGISWETGMGIVFWGAVSLLALTLLQVRYWLIANIPASLRVGITAGIGFFIALLGLTNAGIVVANPTTFLALGNLHDPKVLLGILSFFIIIVFATKNFHASVLVSIVVITGLALVLGLVQYNGLVSSPENLTSVVGKVDISGAFKTDYLGLIFAFMLVNLFDSSGTLIGVTDKIGITDKQGRFPNMRKALLVDSISSVAGSYMATSSVTAYVESTSGVAVGGRTGLTAIVTGVLFLFVIFLSPLASMVPAYATAGSLIYVGILMSASLINVTWDDLTEATPAFITAVMMPFTFSITEGIALGFISYVVLKALSGKFKDISVSVLVVAILFLVKIAFVD